MMKEFELEIDTSISELIELQKYIHLNNLKGIKVMLKEQPAKEKDAMAGHDVVNALVFIIGAKVTEIVLEELFHDIKDFFKSRRKNKADKPSIIVKTKNDKEYIIEKDEEFKKAIKHLGEL